MGTRSGLSLLEPNASDTRFVNIPIVPEETSTDAQTFIEAVIFSMAEDDQGGLWLGSEGDGLFEWVAPDGQDRPETSFLKRTQASGTFLDLHWHSAGRLWAATSQGLLRLDRDGKVEAAYGMDEGLPGTMIRGILEDDDGRLWLATNHGLSRFDPLTEKVRNFDHRDGLQGNAFSSKAAFRGASGEMFFGGWRGLNAFFPDRLQADPHAPSIVFSDFRLAGRSMGPASRNPQSPLSQAIHLNPHLVLGPTHRDFGFEIAALHFAAPTKNRYQYQLSGASEDWIDLDPRHRFLQYSRLPPGEYELRVRAANKDGLWTPDPALLKITVQAPFWQSRWAYGLYALAFGLVLMGLHRRQQTHLSAERQSTRLAKAAAKLERTASRRLRNLDKLKDEFLFKTSHELRTPVYGMTGLAESLIEDAGDRLSTEMKDDLQMIVSSGYRLSRLINDILDFSKLQHQSLQIHPRPLDLRSTVEGVVALAQPLASYKDLELINCVPADAPPVWADRDRVHQILHNLIGNGIKFTEQGSITVSADADDDWVRIHVADTGMGISLDDQQRIFDAFEQVDTKIQRRFGGTGIGLAVTRQLVELHGGKIKVTSELGQGACFTFTLKRSDEEVSSELDLDAPLFEDSAGFTLSSLHVAPPAETKLPSPPSRALQADLQGKKILVADDDPVNRRILKSYLGQEECEVTSVANGSEALKRARTHRFDLVLVDIMMPGLSGFDVCAELRRKHSLEELPILFLSALNQPADIINALAHGGNDYLTKPISKGELLARITPHLRLAEIHNSLGRQVAHQTSELKILHGLLPICSNCKKIRQGDGRWNELESYLTDHSEAKLSHSVCPSCAHHLYPDLNLDLNETPS